AGLSPCAPGRDLFYFLCGHIDFRRLCMVAVELVGEQRDGLGVDFRLVPLLDDGKIRLALIPALAAFPAVVLEIVGGGSEHVRRAANQIGMAFAVEVAGVLNEGDRKEWVFPVF